MKQLIYTNKKMHIICFFLLSFFTVSCSSHAESLIPFSVDGIETSSLQALNNNAIKGMVTQDDGGYLYLYFPDSVIGDESIKSMKLSFCDGGEKAVGSIAFLMKDDFKSKYKLKKELPPRSMAQAFINGEKNMAVSVDIPKGARGFLVYSSKSFRLLNVLLTRKKSSYGWKKTQDGMWCGFTKYGGIFPKKESLSFDFKGAPVNAMHYSIYLREEDTAGVLGNQKECSIVFSSNTLSLRRAPHQVKVTINPHLLKEKEALVVPKDNSDMIEGIVLEPCNSALLYSDPGLILQWPQDEWRNDGYEVFLWDQFPNIVIFDTKNYTIQSLFFKRLAFFVEKEGYAGNLWKDDVIESLHGYNAHDYNAKDLARFFNAAEKERFSLNEYEHELKTILFECGLLKRNPDATIGYNEGALASFSRESPEWLREKLLTHELLHGLYFTHKSYRDSVLRVYNTIDRKTLAFLLRYWETNPSLSYDTNDKYLVKNELMAYLMQQSISSIKPYYADNIAQWKSTNKNLPDLAQYIRDTKAQGFVDAALILQDFLFKNWGFAAGRVALMHIN